MTRPPTVLPPSRPGRPRGLAWLRETALTAAAAATLVALAADEALHVLTVRWARREAGAGREIR